MTNTVAQFKKDLEIKGFSDRTVDAYVRLVRLYRDHLDRPIDPDAAGKQVKDFFHYMLHEKNASRSYVRQTYGALKYYYTVTLGLEWDVDRIPRVRKTHRLPEILSGEEVRRLLSVTKNIKHKAMLMVTYSAGLRVSETAALKLADIDSDRMTIRVDQGKGKKDRYTLLAEQTLQFLRGYWRMYEPTHWLFEGQEPTRHLNVSSIQRAFGDSRKKARIKRHVTVHSLRHSFATHLLEQGTDIHVVQRLLGHASIQGTTINLRLKMESLTKVTSPLDDLLDDEQA
jgi:integrase/recombinase XerD